MKYCKILTFGFLIVSVLFSANAKGQGVSEKPNFVFLVIEDTSPYLLPPYGNIDIETPNLMALAETGVVFTRAFANGPQCSPARSSLISGNYSTTYGTDWHRNPHITPQQYFFPQYLREAGYFTVNAGKTDYNVTREVQQAYYPLAWDKMSGYASKTGKPNASYNDAERSNKPFFAQFNNMTTHMSRITTVNIENREPTVTDPSKVNLPPHVPDLPEMRSDYALHLDGVRDADKWVGFFIEDLKKRGLYDNTIVFFFTDHGGCLPRGKAFGYNTSYQCGLIISAPPKWQHLLPSKAGTKSDRLVEFADFGPTLLSMAGVKPPDHMQGKAFMGQYAEPERDYAYCFRTNTEDHFDPSRSVYSKKYQYIKYYTPHKIDALRQSYQWGMPGQVAWDRHFLDGECAPVHRQYYEAKPREMLFDIENDPFCIHNLAADPSKAGVLAELRAQLSKHIRETKDVGFFPVDVRNDLVKKGIVHYEFVRQAGYDLELLHNLVEKASSPRVADVDFFAKMLEHERPEIRFWAASGLAYLFKQGQFAEMPSKLYALLNDEFGSVSAVAAYAIVAGGDIKRGCDELLRMATANNSFAWSSMEDLGAAMRPYLSEINNLAKTSKNGSTRYSARSILINFGKMPLSELYEPEAVDEYLKAYRDRIKNWAPTLP